MRSYLRMMLFALGLLAGVQIGSDRPLLPAAGCPPAAGKPQPGPFSGDGGPAFQRRSDGPDQPLSYQPDPVFAKDAASLQLLVSQRQTLQQEVSTSTIPGIGNSPTCCCAPSPSSGRIPCKTTATWCRSSRPPSSAAWRQACSQPCLAICCSAWCCCRFAGSSRTRYAPR